MIRTLRERMLRFERWHNPTFESVESLARLNLVIAVAVLLSFAVVGAAACGRETTRTTAESVTVVPKTTLTVAGAGGTSRVLKLLAAAYDERYDDLGFQFPSGSGSSGGVKGVLAGQFHLGAMSRPPKEEEMTAGIEYLRFALDRVAVVTSHDLTIADLTRRQVADIFTGAITNWSEVGGPAAPIKVLVREEKDSNTKILRSGVVGDAEFAPGSAVMTSEGDTKTALSNSTNAIGYLAYSGVRIEDLPVNPVSIDGQHPGLVSGNYPLEPRPLGVAYLSSNAGEVQPYLDFLRAAEVRTLLTELGIVPVGPAPEARTR